MFPSYESAVICIPKYLVSESVEVFHSSMRLNPSGTNLGTEVNFLNVADLTFISPLQLRQILQTRTAKLVPTSKFCDNDTAKDANAYAELLKENSIFLNSSTIFWLVCLWIHLPHKRKKSLKLTEKKLFSFIDVGTQTLSFNVLFSCPRFGTPFAFRHNVSSSYKHLVIALDNMSMQSSTAIVPVVGPSSPHRKLP